MSGSLTTSDSPRLSSYDAIVVGSGPNGLGAAIAMAREGLSVLVVEAAHAIGGGTRSAELTLPGFVHDVCSAIHPFAAASPFFGSLPLAEHGLELIHPPAPLAHPLDGAPAAILERSIEQTGHTLADDAVAYRLLMEPLAASASRLYADLLGPFRIPRHPRDVAGFGLRAIGSARGLAERWFRNEPARALFAGMAAHSVLPLERPPSAAVGLMLGLTGHAVGWPLPRGGSQRIADALASILRRLGGEIVTGLRLSSLEALPRSRAILFDTSPRELVRIAGHRLPRSYATRLRRYRYGPGVFKVDWALDGPIPWRDPECGRAATVHLGGTLDEVAASEGAVWRGEHPERPFVLLAQQSLFDPSRAPEGKQTGWAYCHTPHGSPFDMAGRIEAQVERFAPGFRDRILGRSVSRPADLERHNSNLVGGDVTGGVQDFGQLFTRPVARLDPYATPAPGLYLCSASTPPGGGVHGMCGYFAARSALRDVFRIRLPPPSAR